MSDWRTLPPMEPFPCVRGKVPKADGGKRICIW